MMFDPHWLSEHQYILHLSYILAIDATFGTIKGGLHHMVKGDAAVGLVGILLSVHYIVDAQPPSNFKSASFEARYARTRRTIDSYNIHLHVLCVISCCAVKEC